MKNFFDIPSEFSDIAKARVVFVPWGLEKTTSYAKGTAGAPQALLQASHQVELFDDDFDQETYKAVGGIATLFSKPALVKASHVSSIRNLENVISKILRLKKLPLIIGGEHSLTLGPIRAFHGMYGKKLAILHFDAHADLRPSYGGDALSHASAMHMVLPYISRLVSFGVRNVSEEERSVIRRNASKIHMFRWRKDLYPIRRNFRDVAKKAARLLKNKAVYVSFDVDVLDPAVIGSSTGTPEPGGFSFDETLDIFENILPHVNVVGADFVEYRPISGQHAPDFAVAKLMYKFLGIAL